MPIDVRAFSVAELKTVLKETSRASSAVVNSKLHSKYFEDYLTSPDIGAETIVIERPYIDRDFLDDFAAYYVRCFQRYEAHCCRLHFFSQKFNGDDLEKLIVGEEGAVSMQSLQAGYLGFIVIRPLPRTIIGRTCLKTYGSDNGRRKFPITRTYNVSLYGIRLQVESLGFQEQDSVAGACATSALWSILQGTGKTFQHAIPSSAAISNLAERHSANEARRAPNRGLTDDQALTAIRSVDLEPLQINVREKFDFQSSVYAYLRGNIPLYLGVQLLSVTATGPDRSRIDRSDSDAVRESGLHAVAVTGLSLGTANETPLDSFRLRATRVDKIFAHDDQVGPFARMELQSYVLHGGGKPDEKVFALRSSLRANINGQEIIAVPDILIVPLYHKIRIPQQFVLSAVYTFDIVMKKMLNGSSAGYKEDEFTWDIMLVTGNDLVEYLRMRQDIEREKRLKLATTPLPRFYWQASLHYDKQPVMTVLFDATDLEQGDVVVHILEEEAGFCGAARTLALKDQTLRDRELHPDWVIWNWLRRNP